MKKIKSVITEGMKETYEKKPLNYKKIAIVLSILVTLILSAVFCWLYLFGGKRWTKIKDRSTQFVEILSKNNNKNWGELASWDKLDSERIKQDDFIDVIYAQNSDDDKIVQKINHYSLSDFIGIINKTQKGNGNVIYDSSYVKVQQAKWNDKLGKKPSYIDYSVSITTGLRLDEKLKSKWDYWANNKIPFNRSIITNLNIFDTNEIGKLNNHAAAFLDFNKNNKISKIRFTNYLV